MRAGKRLFVFIRAINVGGRRLTNDQLIEPLVRMGFDDVAAYQAAGNITFRSEDPSEVESERVSAALADTLGFTAPVFVRSLAELRAIVDRRPFSDGEMRRTEGRVQVTFLQREPSSEAVGTVLAMATCDDQIRFSGREWFWLPSKGVADSRLRISTIEEALGPMTMRNARHAQPHARQIRPGRRLIVVTARAGTVGRACRVDSGGRPRRRGALRLLHGPLASTPATRPDRRERHTRQNRRAHRTPPDRNSSPCCGTPPGT